MWNHGRLSAELWFIFGKYCINLSKRNQDQVKLLQNNGTSHSAGSEVNRAGLNVKLTGGKLTEQLHDY